MVNYMYILYIRQALFLRRQLVENAGASHKRSRFDGGGVSPCTHDAAGGFNGLIFRELADNYQLSESERVLGLNRIREAGFQDNDGETAAAACSASSVRKPYVLPYSCSRSTASSITFLFNGCISKDNHLS